MGQFAEGSIEAELEDIDVRMTDVFRLICVDDQVHGVDVDAVLKSLNRVIEKAKDVEDAISVYVSTKL